MRKEIEKPVKAYICVIVGLVISALLGQPNVITIPVTAILVMGTGQNVSRQGIKKYMAGRVAVQFLDSAIIVTTMWLLQRFTSLELNWITVLITMAITLPPVMYLDYRLKVSPTYITTVTVSGLVLITGSAKQWTYPLTRILLVAIGCALGYVLSLWILPRDRAQLAGDALQTGAENLLDAMEQALRGNEAVLAEAVVSSRAAIQAIDSDLIPLLTDRGSEQEIIRLEHLARSYKALQQVAVFWGERKLHIADHIAWTEELQRVFSIHRGFLEASSPVPMEHGPLPPARDQDETVLLGAFIVYREALEKLAVC